jgi:hypothetical protein
LVKLLASRGAKLDARDKQGRTPLDVALGTPGTAGAPGGGAARGRGARAGGGGGAPNPPANESTVKLLRELTESAAAPK